MSWIQTNSGRKVDPLALTENDICLNDIANSLAMQVRFNGHLDHFYSVAEHSLLVASITAQLLADAHGGVEENMPEDMMVNHMKWALLHDATEAYLSDIVRPLEPSVWLDVPVSTEVDPCGFVPQSFGDVEETIMGLIATKYGLEGPMPEFVKTADNIACVTEATVMGRNMTPLDWSFTEKSLTETDPTFQFANFDPQEAKRYFVHMLRVLGITDDSVSGFGLHPDEFEMEVEAERALAAMPGDYDEDDLGEIPFPTPAAKHGNDAEADANHDDAPAQ